MLKPSDFHCRQCGECCKTYTVKLSDKDIKAIEKAGYHIDKFAEPDNFDPKTGKYSLKRTNNRCIFLTEKNNRYICRIYRYRPEICRDYPFNQAKSVESCQPGGRT